jgi:hypothetical protein
MNRPTYEGASVMHEIFSGPLAARGHAAFAHQRLPLICRIKRLPKTPRPPACALSGWLFVRFYRYGELSGERPCSVMI